MSTTSNNYNNYDYYIDNDNNNNYNNHNINKWNESLYSKFKYLIFIENIGIFGHSYALIIFNMITSKYI